MNTSTATLPTDLAATRAQPRLSPRGPLSAAVLQRLSGDAGGTAGHGAADEPGSAEGPRTADARGAAGAAATDTGSLVELAHRALERSSEIRTDDDVQLALFFLYASSYGALEGFSPDLEWDGELIEARRVLEAAFERELRTAVPVPELPRANAEDVAKTLFELTGADSGPSLAKYFAKRATEEQSSEFLIQRSIYTLREADPHSWAIPRLRGRPKAALVEIQSDEYGGGRPERVHAEIFAATMRAAGLDDGYAVYLDRVPAITLASQNMMSMFGLNRRLIGAIVGHLAAFEMTSSIPNKMYGDGFRRLGFGVDVTDYFDEHVEADAVHEQIAGRDLAGALAEDRPELLPDIMFGAAACLAIDGEVAGHMLDRWTRGESSLRPAGAADGGTAEAVETPEEGEAR